MDCETQRQRHEGGVGEEEKAQAVAQQIFERIEAQFPARACKIVGMLMELGSEALEGMLKDQNALEANVKEALEVLQDNDQGIEGGASHDSDMCDEKQGQAATPARRNQPSELDASMDSSMDISMEISSPETESKSSIDSCEQTPSTGSFGRKMSYVQIVSGGSSRQTPAYNNTKRTDIDLQPRKLAFGRKSANPTPRKIYVKKQPRIVDLTKESAEQLASKLEAIDESLPSETVASNIIRILNEPKKDLIEFVVNEVGNSSVVKICRETAAVIRAGGMKRADGKGKRTPGGILLTILRNYVSDEEYKRFYKVVGSKAARRNTKAIRITRRVVRRRVGFNN